ncbi:hypothetical protein SBOR_9560 [Sclerotinia borealis F-4128]|uniref:NADAR domain-containing protein n=1 Tax=Sclerotinia borealis (strain F-4128) TaxID=1432307 RepID=W9C2D5_SCLBF|nr:hypothetical protein SBOR_9560 [Sclerotinia borealis F-4128]
MSHNGPIFFWHPEGGDYPFLSQHYPCEFPDGNGQIFTSTEQYMMYHKAIHFDDIPTSLQILECTNPRTIKALGRSVKRFDDEEWDKVKFEIVVQGNVLKFSKGGKKLRNQLEETGQRELVEASPFDKIWGIGIKGGPKECRRQERDGTLEERRKEWGMNLLGKAIVKARRRIREAEVKGGNNGGNEGRN